MCGIVGLFLKDEALQPRLGALLAGMLAVMCDRGPDSAGFAVYGSAEPGRVRLTLRSREAAALDPAVAALREAVHPDIDGDMRGTHMVLTLPSDRERAARDFLRERRPDVQVVGAGSRMQLFKEVGLPVEVAARFDLAAMTGTHGIGHTRMATESSVTTEGAHPFSTGSDQCLVHNGSLSNHNAVRRTLHREGIPIATKNDSEVAAGYLSWRMRQGASLAEALESGLTDLDGFYTFVVGTESGFAVLRDPVSCKPAVMAETDAYVAFGSEYRALAGLPGIETARIWEPEPATVYAWERAA